jgi:hypothetical protein
MRLEERKLRGVREGAGTVALGRPGRVTLGSLSRGLIKARPFIDSRCRWLNLQKLFKLAEEQSSLRRGGDCVLNGCLSPIAK